MRHLTMTEEDFHTERQVVLEERRLRTEDVQQAARTYLHPERVLRVIVGNLEQAGREAGPSSQAF